MMARHYRAQSKIDHYRADGGNPMTEGELKVGCLQRIADATEKMAASYVNLETDRDRYKQWYYEKRDECERLAKVIAGLRGQVTKQVNRARAAEAAEGKVQ